MTVFCFSLFFQFCCHHSTTTAAPVTIVTAKETRENIMRRDINSMQGPNQDQEILSRVEQAVNISFSRLSIEEIKKNLTRHIVRELLEGGINKVIHPAAECQPRSEDYLRELFLRSNAPSCLQLSLHNNLTTDFAEGGQAEYVVSGNASCVEVLHHQQCVLQQPASASGSTSVCPSSAMFREITPSQSDNIFPRYMLYVHCDGCSTPYHASCSSQAPGCFYEEKRVSFNQLKRSGGCNSEGFEEWAAVTDHLLQVNAGCSCKYAG